MGCRAKLDLVRAHAEQLQSSVVNNPNVTVDHIQVGKGGEGGSEPLLRGPVRLSAACPALPALCSA